MTTTVKRQPITDPMPTACPGRPHCTGAGHWGATGILPPGHIIQSTNHGYYLAHGYPAPLTWEGDQA